MDFIDEKIGKLSRWLHNLSLKKALTFYILLCILFVIVLTAVTLSFCDQWDKLIWTQYYDGDIPDPRTYVVYYEDYSKLTKTDRVLTNLIDFMQTWSPFIYSICGIIGVTRLFYNRKLKEPLKILKEATDMVGKNNLDIEFEYENKDEMGELCASFNLMRKQLISNNQKMWDMMEEQKRLNAAFAHDLRTPLTVLRGYTDFLNQYVPEGKIDEKKLISTLSLMSNHIRRLERYSNTMKEINSLEAIPVKKSSIKGAELTQRLNEVISILDSDQGIRTKLSSSLPDEMEFYLDTSLVMEVFENLISNALRYAKKEIEVILTAEDQEKLFLLSVADDGKGFSEKELGMATKPYYTDALDQDQTHFGIGLYICKLLCEKHGGWISTTNRLDIGAIVEAAFQYEL
jgi:two-component system, OmpR family, lantibiotic biosynthesis sensor histidine kinase NisK/SpaK